MTFLTPIWGQDGKYPAQYDRLALAGSFTPGVGDKAHCKVSQRSQGASMSVDIAAGLVVVPDGTGGVYACVSDAVANVPVAAAPAAGTSRIDRVVATVTDANAQGQAGTALSWAFFVLTGTPASSNPVAPAVPAYSYRVADITVASGAVSIVNANIADWRGQAIPRQSSPVVREVMTATKGTPPGGWWGLGGLVLPVVGPHVIQASWFPVIAVPTNVGIAIKLQVLTRNYFYETPEFNVGTSGAMDWPILPAAVDCAVWAEPTLQVNTYCRTTSGTGPSEVRGAVLRAVATPCTEADLKAFGLGQNANANLPPWPYQ